MAANDQLDVSIFRLPDELLMEICSYITSIVPKMELEQISQRFKRVSSHPTSWKGIHSLQLMMKCSIDYFRPYVFKTSCDYDNVHLNRLHVPLQNWPKAIESFLQRTTLHQFTMHYGKESCSPDSSVIFSRLTQIFGENKAKIKINSLEIHGINPEIGKNEQFDVFYLYLFELSIPFLRDLGYFELNSSDEHDNLKTLAWPIIKNCSKLKSIGFHCYDDGGTLHFDALMGKPLTELMLHRFFDDDQDNVEQLVNVMNGVSSDGLQSLSVEGESQLQLQIFHYLHDHLTENARNKLKELKASRSLIGSFLHSFAVIFWTFPNIEKLYIDSVRVHQVEVEDNFTNERMHTVISSSLPISAVF